MNTIKVRRSWAAGMIEDLRRLLADLPHQSAITRPQIETLLERWGIPPLDPCTGEAHANPYIDYCQACAPRWGSVGPKVVVT